MEVEKINTRDSSGSSPYCILSVEFVERPATAGENNISRKSDSLFAQHLLRRRVGGILFLPESDCSSSVHCHSVYSSAAHPKSMACPDQPEAVASTPNVKDADGYWTRGYRFLPCHLRVPHETSCTCEVGPGGRNLTDLDFSTLKLKIRVALFVHHARAHKGFSLDDTLELRRLAKMLSIRISVLH